MKRLEGGEDLFRLVAEGLGDLPRLVVAGAVEDEDARGRRHREFVAVGTPGETRELTGPGKGRIEIRLQE